MDGGVGILAVRHYRLVLTASGPIHVGNGERYGKKDYFSHNRGIAILDVPKFVSQLGEEDFKEYICFLQSGTGDRNGNLQCFLEDRPTVWAIAQKSIAYTIDSQLSKARRGVYQYHDVLQFIKDAYGKPYVPGSSVKGMLRTALLTCMVLEDRSSYRNLFDSSAARNANTKKIAGRRIEQRAFRRVGLGSSPNDATSDIMRFVSVSDSKPLSTADLVFVKKYDKFSKADDASHKLNFGKRTDRSGNSLDVYRECLKLGTRIEFDIDIDERIDGHISPISLNKDGLVDVFRQFSSLYSECFLNAFDEAGESEKEEASRDGRCCYVYQDGLLAGQRCRNKAVDGARYCRQHTEQGAVSEAAGGTCYLGGGLDYNSKTVVSALFEDKQERLHEVSHILYAQFPTMLDPSRHAALGREIRDAGFDFKPMKAKYRNGRLLKAKSDHRHWRDFDLGVSPHTMKFGLIDGERFPMGKCDLRIEDR